ncbi:MAG TPA: ABC transporter permease subunit [Candidatus Limnocylindrales bacterium]|jgi:arabinogalactan oligomer/maltooligosaccharide transport system permease protein|nr:ABC transporter permease subunit [Candidatus Limnocylindrales bacterium]
MSTINDVRRGRDVTAYFRFGRRVGARRGEDEKPLPWGKQIVLQLILIFISFTVLFPILWIFSISVDPRGLFRPEGLNLIPPGATLAAYQKVLAQPTSNPISFIELMLNSLKIALGSSAVAVGLGVTAAYAFSRLKFRGREALMIGILGVLMLPSVATIIPLYVFLNQFRIEFGDLTFNLRASLVGVSLAVVSSQLPFAIWNLKGYLDTIPRDLEEAASVDGATQNQIFTRVVLPLATPAIAVTGFLGFLGGWTEYLTCFMFIGGTVSDWTLSIALNSMVGQYARNTPWSEFAAFAILFALPVSLVFFFFQRFLVGGLAVGGVKG